MLRRYDPARAVPVDVLSRLLSLVTFAPSAGFTQGWDFVVLRDRESRDDFWAISTAARRRARPSGSAGHPSVDDADRWLSGVGAAPVLVLCLADPERYRDRYALPDKGWTDRDSSPWTAPYWDVDTGMAALLILLGAHDAGIGGCFFGVESGSEDALRTRFGIPSDRRFVAVLSLGYPPAETAGSALVPRGSGERPSYRPKRRALGDYTHDESFGLPWSAADDDHEA